MLIFLDCLHPLPINRRTGRPQRPNGALIEVAPVR
jgi:hypothetical protein